MTANPRVRIEVRSALSSQLHQLLDEEAVDIAIVKRTRPISEATRRPRTSECVLRSEPLHWVASESLEFDHLKDVPLVAFPVGCAYRDAATGTLRASEKGTFFSYVSASYDNIRAAVSAGLGVGVLPQSAIGQGQVVLAGEHGFPELPYVHLAMIQRTQGGLPKEFAGLLEDVFNPSMRPSMAPTLTLF